MTHARQSLVRRLSWRLILLQVLALSLVVAVASIPEPGRWELQELDNDALMIIADHLEQDGERLGVNFPPALQSIVDGMPDFWFLAADRDGRHVEYGPVPPDVRDFFGGIAPLVEVEIYWEAADGRDAMIGARVDSAIGLVTILTGGGPKLGPLIGRLKQINPWYVAVLAVVITALALAIPMLLRRDLSGVSRVADEASRIDIDQPGTRLTEANVPLELQGMVRAMNAALARLDDGLERRRRFLATAAHELRTPVAVLSMRIETLPPGAERRQLMLDVARLGALSDQLLDLERLDGDGHRFQSVDLVGAVSEAVTDIAPLAVASAADLSFDAPDLPVKIMGDRQALLRIVTNLVHNAIAHGRPGVSIAVEVARPAEIRVRDNGPGVAAQDRAQIFEPFFRRSGTPGSGLGLHLVQEIVTRHGGTIQVTDAAGGGAEFIVRFTPAQG